MKKGAEEGIPEGIVFLMFPSDWQDKNAKGSGRAEPHSDRPLWLAPKRGKSNLLKACVEGAVALWCVERSKAAANPAGGAFALAGSAEPGCAQCRPAQNQTSAGRRASPEEIGEAA